MVGWNLFARKKASEENVVENDSSDKTFDREHDQPVGGIVNEEMNGVVEGGGVSAVEEDPFELYEHGFKDGYSIGYDPIDYAEQDDESDYEDELEDELEDVPDNTEVLEELPQEISDDDLESDDSLLGRLDRRQDEYEFDIFHDPTDPRTAREDLRAYDSQLLMLHRDGHWDLVDAVRIFEIAYFETGGTEEEKRSRLQELCDMHAEEIASELDIVARRKLPHRYGLIRDLLVWLYKYKGFPWWYLELILGMLEGDGIPPREIEVQLMKVLGEAMDILTWYEYHFPEWHDLFARFDRGEHIDLEDETTVVSDVDNSEEFIDVLDSGTLEESYHRAPREALDLIPSSTTPNRATPVHPVPPGSTTAELEQSHAKESQQFASHLSSNSSDNFRPSASASPTLGHRMTEAEWEKLSTQRELSSPSSKSSQEPSPTPHPSTFPSSGRTTTSPIRKQNAVVPGRYDPRLQPRSPRRARRSLSLRSWHALSPSPGPKTPTTPSSSSVRSWHPPAFPTSPLVPLSSPFPPPSLPSSSALSPPRPPKPTRITTSSASGRGGQKRPFRPWKITKVDPLRYQNRLAAPRRLPNTPTRSHRPPSPRQRRRQQDRQRQGALRMGACPACGRAFRGEEKGRKKTATRGEKGRKEGKRAVAAAATLATPTTTGTTGTRKSGRVTRKPARYS